MSEQIIAAARRLLRLRGRYEYGDRSHYIAKCPVCRVERDSDHPHRHAADCVLGNTLADLACVLAGHATGESVPR